MSAHYGIETKFFLRPYIFFNSHAMLIYAYAKEFTHMNLVTVSISRSLIRMKFYFVSSLIRLYQFIMNELIVKYKVASCHYTCTYIM